MVVRGGFGEPYCSQECHDNGGRYIAVVMLKNQSGVCGVCREPVQAPMYGVSDCAIVPYEGVNLFICQSCAREGRAHLESHGRCCMCRRSLGAG
jgi:hypothetical protein